MATDPYTRVYLALIAIFRNSTALTDAGLLIGNLMDDSADGQRRKDIKANGTKKDFFNMALNQARFGMTPFGTNSKIGNMGQVYVLSIKTDQLTLLKVNQVKHIVYTELLKAGPELGLSGLVWKWTIENATDQLDPDGELHGMSAVLGINVEMYQSKSVLTQ